MLELLLASNKPVEIEIYPYALFAGGSIGDGAMNTTTKYRTDAKVMVTGRNLSIQRYRSVGLGISEFALIALSSANSAGSTSNKYAHSTDTVTAGSTFTWHSALYAAGFNNGVYGILTGGVTTSYTTALNTTSSYQFSSNTAQSRAGMTGKRFAHVGFSNSEYGYITSGMDETAAILRTTQRWWYASQSWNGSTTAITANRAHGCAISNTEHALIAHGGGGAATEKYTYANNSVVAGTSLTSYGSNTAGTGDASLGFISGTQGPTDGINFGNTYNFANSTVTNETALQAGRYGAAAASTSPGWF